MTWEYIPVLNALIQVLVTIALGFLVGWLGVLSHDEFVPQAVKFVFNICLPSLVLKGIGIGIDFYAETNIWSYIVAFLILRAIALVLALGVILLTNWKEQRPSQGLGHVAVLWLTLTWISTVIMGIPISSAVFDNANLGRKYGILAGMSSFIFQLPFQLIFLEIHRAEEKIKSQMALQKVAPVLDIESNDANPIDSSHNNKKSSIIVIEESGRANPNPNEQWWKLIHADDVSYRVLWMKIGKQLVRNPVLLGIFGGLVISLSKAGKYLRCPADENCILCLDWISLLLGWLGDCVSPVSLFTMGLWMHGQGIRKLFAAQLPRLSLFMLSKLVIVPLIMVGLAKGLGLHDEAGRAAILISSLPISLASFSFGKKYKIGEEDLAANVAVGTLLMLPTVLVWNVLLDEFGLYPIN